MGAAETLYSLLPCGLSFFNVKNSFAILRIGAAVSPQAFEVFQTLIAKPPTGRVHSPVVNLKARPPMSDGSTILSLPPFIE